MRIPQKNSIKVSRVACTRRIQSRPPYTMSLVTIVRKTDRREQWRVTCLTIVLRVGIYLFYLIK